MAEQEYSDFLESSFQIEEALEGFHDLNLRYLANTLGIQKEFINYEKLPRDIARYIALIVKGTSKEINPYQAKTEAISDIDRFDKAIDAIIYAIGSMAKLGLTPQQIQKGILAVNTANMQKLEMPVDEHGKKIKPKDFIGPEAELQKILNERM